MLPYINADGTITIYLPDQAMAVCGLARTELELVELVTESEVIKEKVSTMPFNLIIERSVFSNKDIESKNESGIIDRMAKHMSDYDNPHKTTKNQVDLGNVDNTADKDKNVLSATKLTTARKINDTLFDGSKDITTEKWGKTRNISLVGHISGDVDFDGSKDIKLYTKHYGVERTDTESSSSLCNNDTFTAIKSVTSDQYGHITDVETEKITLNNPSDVTGVRGNAESIYRTGNVEISPENLMYHDIYICGIEENDEKIITMETIDDLSTGIGAKMGAIIENAFKGTQKALRSIVYILNTCVRGIKGNAESEYRYGKNINITPENLGITVINNTLDKEKNVNSAVHDGNGNII